MQRCHELNWNINSMISKFFEFLISKNLVVSVDQQVVLLFQRLLIADHFFDEFDLRVKICHLCKKFSEIDFKVLLFHIFIVKLI